MIRFSPCREKANLSKTRFLFDFAQEIPGNLHTGIAAINVPLISCFVFSNIRLFYSAMTVDHPSFIYISLSPCLPLPMTI